MPYHYPSKIHRINAVECTVPDPRNRRQTKSQRRIARRATAEKRERQRRLLLLGGGALAVALLAVVALILANQNDESETPEAALALDEVENDDRYLGDPDAPVDFVVYSDFQCPFCKQFDDRDLPQVVDTFVESGDVRVEWRPLPIVSGLADIPLESDENESVQSAEAALYAADQGEFWPCSEALFAAQGAENSGVYTTEMLEQTAADLGLDTGAFNECLESCEKEEEVLAFREDAIQLGVSGTPTFLINDHLVTYTRGGFDTLEEQINQALAGEPIDT